MWGGGSIVRKTPDTALYSKYVSTLWSRPSDSSDMCVWQGGAKIESILGGGGAELNGRLKGFNERNVKREKRMAKRLVEHKYVCSVPFSEYRNRYMLIVSP